MGLSIHYNGRFDRNASLSQMISEVKDIAEVFKWRYTILETEFPEDSFDQDNYNDKIYGIVVSPENCEPVFLTFLSNRRMSSKMHLEFFGQEGDSVKKEYLYMLSTKTQYAGIKVHMGIIDLLRYLSKKYFSEFNVNDEGEYWETNDEVLLSEIFNRYSALLDEVSDAMQCVPVNEGESLEEYFNRVLRRNRE